MMIGLNQCRWCSAVRLYNVLFAFGTLSPKILPFGLVLAMWVGWSIYREMLQIQLFGVGEMRAIAGLLDCGQPTIRRAEHRTRHWRLNVCRIITYSRQPYMVAYGSLYGGNQYYISFYRLWSQPAQGMIKFNVRLWFATDPENKYN